MGWASCGTDSKGRSIGYAYEARCDHPGCDAKIDRGLAYACGGMHGEDSILGADTYSCEGYFCSKHLYYESVVDVDESRKSVQLCAECRDNYQAETKVEDSTI